MSGPKRAGDRPFGPDRRGRGFAEPRAFAEALQAFPELGPSDEQLAQLIKDVGPHRVMMGADFPWYDIDHTVDRVMDLPLLSREEKEGNMGANAVNILGLAVADR